MPGTTRYSATFDRPYEEEEKSQTENAAANGSRRSRSQSWQANLGMCGRTFDAWGSNKYSQRSSSTDSGAQGVEHIPTRTVSKTVVKTHNNPFQFVKVGSCPLYRKAEEQLKKAKEVKKPEVLKEEEEEWQTNLDSWKSRRRKMSEDVFRRQEEIRQFEMEEQSTQANQRKIKTFSEMVESRAHRGRTMSLCLISSPLDLQKWDLENSGSTNSSRPHSEGSEQNSAVNSEDEDVSERRNVKKNDSSNGSEVHAVKNGSTNTCKSKTNKILELSENCMPKDGIYIDSGLESISSSHRTGDTPDSCSDFSQDSGSSIDCDSPRVSGLILNGVNVLEDYNSKSVQKSDSSDSFINMKSMSMNNSFDKNSCNAVESSASKNKSSSLLEDNCNGTKQDASVNSISSSNSRAKNAESNSSQKSSINEMDSNEMIHKRDQSIESENEVFVDDFEEFNAKAKVFSPSNKGSKGKILAVNNEAKQTEAVELFTSTSNPPSNFTNAMESISCINYNDGLDAETPRKEQTDIFSSCVQNSVPKVQNVDESSNDGKVISDLHSQEKKKDPEVKKKEPKKKPAKKKMKAKIVSVETNTKKSDAVEVQKSNARNLDVKEESLNIVFQTQPSGSKDFQIADIGTNKSNIKEQVMLNDVMPVEKIAEEMERLILQQLEEEERAKEFSSRNTIPNAVGSPEHLMAPPKVLEPPKEKPPPPPNAENEGQKAKTPLKRVNSTKRIKKEILKRRSNFLGIENDEENMGCDESKIQRPPALEQILKAEMELDRESRKKLGSAADERLKLEENEIVEKEREIIETLETEERQKNLLNNEEISDIMLEEDRIQKLKDERRQMENERVFTEDQRLRLKEEKQLKEREEFVRRQEVDKSTSAEISAPVLSEVANKSNIPKSPNASLSTETKPNVKLSNIGGDGKTVLNSAFQLVDNKKEIAEKPTVPPKPAVPPKPLKKKEVIRKERERLRQEQEALQREREEHRKKLQMEQDEIVKTQQKTHAPVSRIGPLPFKPSYTPQLTNPISSQPCARENVIFSSQIFHGAQNGISTNSGCIGPVGPVVSKSKPVSSHKKVVQNEPLVQQKVSSIKKQTQDHMTESKYNQNHWLIQEAEMRRITELKERQHAGHFPISQTYLAGDDVCSNSPHVPILPPNVHLNPPVQEKVWNYGPGNNAMKMHPPPISSEKPLGLYPRESAPQPPSKPSRVVPLEKPEQMLSVSGRKRCSHCSEELGRGAAMIIESLQLYYHIHCFQCCVCQAQLGNGSCGTDVRVRNNKLHCHNCYSNDEAGLKFSQV